jgi:hypothetical protein
MKVAKHHQVNAVTKTFRIIHVTLCFVPINLNGTVTKAASVVWG